MSAAKPQQDYVFIYPYSERTTCSVSACFDDDEAAIKQAKKMVHGKRATKDSPAEKGWHDRIIIVRRDPTPSYKEGRGGSWHIVSDIIKKKRKRH